MLTHNHPEGIKGAHAIASAIFIVRYGHSRNEIKGFIQARYRYNLERTLEEIRPGHMNVESRQKSVPEEITAFLLSENFEDAVRNAVSLGGDSDTIAAITGSIADVFYGGVPAYISDETFARLEEDLVEAIGAWNA